MKISDRRIIYVLLIVVILLSTILLYKINTTPHYNTELYNEVYAEYNEIIDKEVAITNNEQVKQSKDIKENEPLKKLDNKVIALIRISKLKILYPILSETSMENLEVAPTKLWGGEPNTVGNFCIIGHNLKNKKQFSELKKLKINDEVEIIDTNGKTIKYSVYKIYKVNDTDLECTNQETDGNKEITLITCTNNKSKRLVIKCKEQI